MKPALKPDNRESEPIDCLLCRGEGLVQEDGHVYECPLCDGWGWIEKSRGGDE